MKLSNENQSKNLLNRAIKTILFSIFVALAAVEIQAQRINEDLKDPEAKPPVVKPAPTPRPRKGSRGQKPPAPPVKKPVPPARPTYNNPPPSVPAQPAAPIVAPPPAPPVQTPTEILARFVNFQQSSSVTMRDWESVVKQTNAILQSNPSDETAKAQLAIAQGELAFSRNDYSNALIQFNAASRFSRDAALPYYGIGRVYVNTKQIDQAEANFERAIKLNKDFALAYKAMGDMLTAQGKAKKAEDYYKKASRAGVVGNASETGNVALGASTATPAGSTDSASDRDFKTARELMSQKKWQMALEKLQPLAAANPTADLYIAVGDSYFGMQAWLSAQQAYRKAIDMNPTSALAFYKSGLVLFETNEFQSAADAFEKSLILDQTGTIINRSQARKWADKAGEKARDMNKSDKKKGLSGLLF